MATAKSDLGQTRNPAGTWDAVSLEQRRTICDWWVPDVLISVEPLEGRKRANQKSAIVTLRGAPNAPLVILMVAVGLEPTTSRM